MLSHLRPAIVMIALFTLLTGVAYPLAITGLAQTALKGPADGSLISRGGAVVGSTWIGQSFASDSYSHGRSSATSAPDPKDSTGTIDAPYNAANSSGSNLGPTPQKLQDRVKGDVATLRGARTAPLPADAVTTSASGLDPDISPDFALMQVPRVAPARKLPEDKVKELVEAHVSGRDLGIFGEPRVNVLELNLDLDVMVPSLVHQAG